ncbi:hypothetical protein ACFY7C_00535 [Streptomyces sp. NPDC012769]|uniref:hypothetical protein n=1 Tax=Streptomyces sp. NPDC012769 TaxID=3364848 RepID=UPI00368DD8E5
MPVRVVVHVGVVSPALIEDSASQFTHGRITEALRFSKTAGEVPPATESDDA